MSERSTVNVRLAFAQTQTFFPLFLALNRILRRKVFRTAISEKQIKLVSAVANTPRREDFSYALATPAGSYVEAGNVEGSPWSQVPLEDASTTHQEISMPILWLTAWRSLCLQPRYRSVVCTERGPEETEFDPVPLRLSAKPTNRPTGSSLPLRLFFTAHWPDRRRSAKDGSARSARSAICDNLKHKPGLTTDAPIRCPQQL